MDHGRDAGKQLLQSRGLTPFEKVIDLSNPSLCGHECRFGGRREGFEQFRRRRLGQFGGYELSVESERQDQVCEIRSIVQCDFEKTLRDTTWRVDRRDSCETGR